MNRTRRTMLLGLTGLIILSLFAMAGQARAADNKKLKVFILSGQSNMVGHCRYFLMANLLTSPLPEDAKLAKLLIADYDTVVKTVKPQMEALQKQIDALAGPAEEALKAAPKQRRLKKGEKPPVLTPEQEAKKQAYEKIKAQVDELAKKKNELMHTVRYNHGTNVRIAAFGEIDGSKRSTGIVGPLAPGCGANAEMMGPEYGFGMAMQQKLDSPVLIIKVSWGGIAIDGGFRPPSSKKIGDEENPAPAPGEKYQVMVKDVHEVLNNLPKYYPGYDAKAGYEIAGFYWFQGFNDQFKEKFVRYKEHMANFIRDIRKEFKTPEMPFVIGVLGTGAIAKGIDYTKASREEEIAAGKENVGKNPVSVAQREAAAMPEFKATVTAVESYPYYDYAIVPLYNTWKTRFSEWNNVGTDRAYHYLGSGRFFARFGYACGEAMLKLMKE